jgi:hypothetical protein
MANEYRWNQDDARAVTEAGYMPLEEYLRLCKENNWRPKPDNSGPPSPDRAKAIPKPSIGRVRKSWPL